MCFLFWQLGLIWSPSLVSPLNHLNPPFLLFLHSLSRNLRLSTLSLFIWAHTLSIYLTSPQRSKALRWQRTGLLNRRAVHVPLELIVRILQGQGHWPGAKNVQIRKSKMGIFVKTYVIFIHFSCIFPINLEQFASIAIATDAAAIFGFTKVHQAGSGPGMIPSG